MRGMCPKKNSKLQVETAPSATPKHSFRLDWPILLYPASILATLVVLYVVSRSIERESPMPRDRGAAEQATSTSGSGERPDAANNGSAAAHEQSPRQSGETGPASAQDNADGTVAQDAPADELQAIDLDQLEGPARIVAMLRMAVQQGDHALIKQCIDELIALGDEAVVSLNELVNAQGRAGLWAAEALARIGTPAATAALLDTLGQTEEGQFKEDLGRRIAGITNHDSWPLLLDTLLQTTDATVARAAVDSLARMADTPVMDEILARYETATTEAEIECLTQLVGNIQSSRATDALLSLAGDITSAVQDSLQQAAIDALAKVGDSQCASYLLRRLEATTPGEGAGVYNAITQIRNQEAYSQLLYAAAGNKEVSAESGQAAAIEALANYPCEETCVLLERIVAEGSNEKVVTAASRTLEAIGRGPYAITASAQSFERSEQMLPIASITK
ncbi:MAG: hypothetical protein ABFD90_15705 [Phycisphaerales bacterium]